MQQQPAQRKSQSLNLSDAYFRSPASSFASVILTLACLGGTAEACRQAAIGSEQHRAGFFSKDGSASQLMAEGDRHQSQAINLALASVAVGSLAAVNFISKRIYNS